MGEHVQGNNEVMSSLGCQSPVDHLTPTIPPLIPLYVRLLQFVLPHHQADQFVFIAGARQESGLLAYTGQNNPACSNQTHYIIEIHTN